MMWRRFNAFVTCKNCRGKPITTNKHSGGGERELARADEQEVLVASTS